MSNATLDRIADEVRALSPDERRQLRDFLDRTMKEDDAARQAALVRGIKGKYAHLGLSSDDFAAAKAEEIKLEERRNRR